MYVCVVCGRENVATSSCYRCGRMFCSICNPPWRRSCFDCQEIDHNAYLAKLDEMRKVKPADEPWEG